MTVTWAARKMFLMFDIRCAYRNNIPAGETENYVKLGYII